MGVKKCEEVHSGEYTQTMCFEHYNMIDEQIDQVMLLIDWPIC